MSLLVNLNTNEESININFFLKNFKMMIEVVNKSRGQVNEC